MGWLKRWFAVLVIVVAVIGLGLASTAAADDGITSTVITEEDPVKYGMLLGKDFKLRPTLAISVVKVNLRNTDFSVSAIPSGGFGVDWRDGLLSVDAIGGFEIGVEGAPNEVYLGILLGVYKYFNFGFLWNIIEDVENIPYMMIGAQLPGLTYK